MDHTQIEEITAVLRESRLTEMEVRRGDVVLRLRRPAPRPAVRPDVPAMSPLEEGGNGEDGTQPSTGTRVVSGLVGVFHALGDPILVGDAVAARQVLGQIESMRLMNDCLAPAAGRVVQVHVEEGQPVEYGQLLFEIAEEPR